MGNILHIEFTCWEKFVTCWVALSRVTEGWEDDPAVTLQQTFIENMEKHKGPNRKRHLSLTLKDLEPLHRAERCWSLVFLQEKCSHSDRWKQQSQKLHRRNQHLLVASVGFCKQERTVWEMCGALQSTACHQRGGLSPTATDPNMLRCTTRQSAPMHPATPAPSGPCSPALRGLCRRSERPYHQGAGTHGWLVSATGLFLLFLLRT